VVLGWITTSATRRDPCGGRADGANWLPVPVFRSVAERAAFGYLFAAGKSVERDHGKWAVFLAPPHRRLSRSPTFPGQNCGPFRHRTGK